MKPRDFLNFFKTKSGKLVLFAAIFGGGLVFFGVLRDRSRKRGDLDMPVTARTNARTNRRWCNRSNGRCSPFARRRQSRISCRLRPTTTTNAPQSHQPSASPQEPTAPTLAPISLFADSAPPTPAKKAVSSVYAPFGRLIPCETVVTVDSASIQTPIIGLSPRTSITPANW